MTFESRLLAIVFLSTKESKYMNIQSSFSILIFFTLFLFGCNQKHYQDPAFVESTQEAIKGNSFSVIRGEIKEVKGFHVQEATLTNLSALAQDKVVLMDFWFSYCAPCLEAMPQLQAFYTQYEQDGLVIVGLNPVDGASKLSRIDEKLSSLHITYPSLVVEEKVADEYVIGTYPTLLLFDQQGQLVHRHIGFTTEESMLELEGKIQDLISK